LVVLPTSRVVLATWKLVQPQRRPASPERGFSQSFLARKLFSCLVDADFVETERFYLRAKGSAPDREGFADFPLLHK
jgi:CRISPR-associated endonuclease/helicase Cas3